MIAGRLHKFLRADDRGSVGLVGLLALVPITLILLTAMNTGQASHEKRHIQDAADAIVMSHQAWAARSLNVIAMNQVAATQLTAVAIGAEALDESLNILRIYSGGAILYIAGHAAGHCPRFKLWPAILACFAQHALEASEAVRALTYVSRTKSRYRLSEVIALSHRSLRALDETNAEIIARFPRAMQDATQAFADRAGLEDWYFYDACVGRGIRQCQRSPTKGGKTLPIHDGGASGMFELCQALSFGTLNGRTGFLARGFPLSRGPLTFGGSPARPNLMRHINEESQIGRRLESFYNWYQRSVLVTFPKGVDRFPQGLNLPFKQQANGTNIFTVLFQTKHADVCLNNAIPNVPFIGGGLRAPVPKIWMANDIGPLERVTLKRPEQMPDDFHTLVGVTAQRKDRFGQSHFERPPRRGYAYAQAGLINRSSADMFSAAWEMRLMESSELDAPRPVARDFERNAAQSFRDFVKLLDAVDGQSGWERVNAH